MEKKVLERDDCDLYVYLRDEYININYPDNISRSSELLPHKKSCFKCSKTDFIRGLRFVWF